MSGAFTVVALTPRQHAQISARPDWTPADLSERTYTGRATFREVVIDVIGAEVLGTITMRGGCNHQFLYVSVPTDIEIAALKKTIAEATEELEAATISVNTRDLAEALTRAELVVLLRRAQAQRDEALTRELKADSALQFAQFKIEALERSNTGKRY